jgi:hypothetical protein
MRIVQKLPLLIITALFVISPLGPGKPVSASSARRPIDMVLLIDNSCSMFPANQILNTCDASGGDPQFLRIVGADLFTARLGFAEPNEADYQLGVISIGEIPEVISHLQPIANNRAQIAGQIANPKPQPATEIVPALQLGYEELVSKRKPGSNNLPSMVMITDGIPYPPGGQSNADIEALVAKHTDVPLFMMLLKNPQRVSGDFDNYIQFWQQLAAKYRHVFVYVIENATQIQATFNSILGQLLSTIPAKSLEIPRATPQSFAISAYTNQVILTLIRKPELAAPTISIKDSNGVEIKEGEAGVSHFSAKGIPVEVFSITPPRLGEDVKGKDWTITSTTAVTMLIDLVGSYNINFVNPPVSPSDIINTYQANDQLAMNRPFNLIFQLLDDAGKAVSTAQVIDVTAISPEGKLVNFITRQSLSPDAQGQFTIQVDLKSLFPDLQSVSGRYTFDIRAGLLDPNDPDSPSVATARLYAQVGNIPFIRSISPLPVYCQVGQAADLRVAIGDLLPEQVANAKVKVFTGENSIWLETKGEGNYRGDLTSICSNLVQSTICSTDQTASLTIQLEMVDAAGSPLPLITKSAEVNIKGIACTPTPQPTLTPTPAPTPTPPPDQDRDGFADNVDKCPTIYGLAQFGGCLPFNYFLYGSGGLLLVVIMGVVLVPWVRVNRLNPPPAIYLLVCRSGLPEDPIDLHKLILKKHAKPMIIGSKRGAHFRLKSLKPVEFILDWSSGVANLRDPLEKEPFVFFRSEQNSVYTSDPKVVLKISTDPENLHC